MVRRVVAPLIFARAVTATMDPTELRRSVQHTMDVCSPAYGVSPHELERAIVEGREDDLYERAIPSKKLMTCHDAVLTDPEAMYPLSLSKRFAARSKYRYGPRRKQRNEDSLSSSSLGYTGIGGGLTTLGLAFHGLRQAFGGRKEPPLKHVEQMSLPADFTPIQESFYSDHSESEESDDESSRPRRVPHFAIATPRLSHGTEPAAIPIHTPRRRISAASQRPSHVPKLLLPP